MFKSKGIRLKGVEYQNGNSHKRLYFGLEVVKTIEHTSYKEGWTGDHGSSRLSLAREVRVL